MSPMQKVSYRRHRFHPDIIRQACARRIRNRRPTAFDHWHIDEVFVNIGGQQMYLWRAVDGEGEVLDVLVQKRRNKRAALKLIRKLLRSQGIRPIRIVTDKLKSYGAAFRDLRLSHIHGRYETCLTASSDLLVFFGLDPLNMWIWLGEAGGGLLEMVISVGTGRSCWSVRWLSCPWWRSVGLCAGRNQESRGKTVTDIENTGGVVRRVTTRGGVALPFLGLDNMGMDLINTAAMPSPS